MTGAKRSPFRQHEDAAFSGLVPVAARQLLPGLVGELRYGDGACAPAPEQRPNIFGGRRVPGVGQRVLIEVPVFQNCAQQLLVTLARRLEEKRPSPRRTPFQQQEHHLAVSGTGRAAERGHLVETVGDVERGAGLEEAPNHIQVSSVGSEEESRRAVAVGSIDGDTGGQ